jgi:DNA-binding response OmpR family regulator
MVEHSDDERILIEDLEIRRSEGLVLAGGHALTLSVREFELLLAMVDRAGGIVRRDELCRAVWRRDLRPGDRSVDVYVSKLRAKLEAAAPGRQFIHTHPGFGYRFHPEHLLDVDHGRVDGAETSQHTAREAAHVDADRATSA